jgi:hypothetical protein
VRALFRYASTASRVRLKSYSRIESNRVPLDSIVKECDVIVFKCKSPADLSPLMGCDGHALSVQVGQEEVQLNESCALASLYDAKYLIVPSHPDGW